MTRQRSWQRIIWHWLLLKLQVSVISCQSGLKGVILCQSGHKVWPFIFSRVGHERLLADLGLGMDGSPQVQQEIDDPDMTVPGRTVQRGQLILNRWKEPGRVQKSNVRKKRRRRKKRRSKCRVTVPWSWRLSGPLCPAKVEP